MDAPKDLSSSLRGLSSLEISSSPPKKEGGVGGGKTGAAPPETGVTTAELAEFVHLVATCPNSQRSVGGKLAASEGQRLSQALLAKGLPLSLVPRAGQQYRDEKGPWETSRTLQHGINAIVDNVLSWAAAGAERRAPKRVAPPRAEPDLVRGPNGRLVERTATVCMLTPEQLARLNATQPPTENAIVIPGSTSAEQSGISEVVAGVAEGGRR